MRWLLSRFRVFEIRDPGGSLYLRRWTLLRVFGRKLMLHEIVRPDYARELHDHPWRFATLILRGGYIETNEHGDSRRRVGRLYYHPAKFRHAIRELPSGTAWTLIFRGRRRREWGFYTECGWMQWRSYCDRIYNGLPICEDTPPAP